jgi:homoserine dehydrogenase
LPEILNESDPLYSIDNEFNAIAIDGSLSGVQTYVGKGAGSLPTGSAVLNDLYLLLGGFRYRYINRDTLRQIA